MNRFKTIVILLIISILFPVSPAHAGYFKRSGEKLGRGFVNVGFSPLEITKAYEENIQDGYLYKTLLVAPFEGLFNAAGRIIIGVYEIATFYVPQKPILKPVYITPGIEEYLEENDDSPT